MSKKTKILKQPLLKLEAFLRAKEQLKKGKNIMLTGMVNPMKAGLISELSTAKYKFVITYDEPRAKKLIDDLSLLGEEAFYYPAKDVIFYFADVHSDEIAYRRAEIFKRILEKKSTTIVLTADALLDKLLPLKKYKKAIFDFVVGEEIDLSNLGRRLLEMGYKRVDLVDGKGQFTVRGGILDIFPVTEDALYRVEFFDDEVDSIRDVNIETRRSNAKHESLRIYPASEFVLEPADVKRAKKNIELDYKNTLDIFKNADDEVLENLELSYEEALVNISSGVNFTGIEACVCYYFENMISVLDIVKNADVFLDEPRMLKQRIDFILSEFNSSMQNRYLSGKTLLKQMEVIFSYGELINAISSRNYLQFSTMIEESDFLDSDLRIDFFAREIEPYHNRYAELVNDLREYTAMDYEVILLSPSMTRARRLAELLKEDGISAYTCREDEMFLTKGAVLITYGAISAGYDIPEAKYLLLTETDILAHKKKRRSKKYKGGEKIDDFSELKAGDYIVHEDHGIGVFDKIERVVIDNIEKDYIKINYAGKDNLYIGINKLDAIRKYVSKEGRKPRLNKLGSNEWVKTKARVKTAIEEVAKELVELYAKRQSLKGFVYSKDSSWEKEFEESFPYEETDDQIMAIEDTKRDMESPKIMDRLICGDVGYGKTEVAIRAAFKAVGDGKQVAYLVPTTILAQQHYNNFVERMKDYPIRIELLSRFRTKNELKDAIKGINNGSVDIVIGTHRLLSKDVNFKDLGLLIIDEEQRFGVKHKEKMKELKNTVDVLTLSATPIPRTLHMSLIGIRDMSVLSHPPHDRVPVRTYVLEKSDELIKDAISRELKRGGQVFYVYNKVKDIDEVAFKVAKLLPEARVSFAHGQMGERELENVMIDFINGDIDVLVATTIIETGLDISNVNAIIIDEAHRLGLSQLYQLRGRVGRSNREAFAYLLYKKDVVLKEDASKRLEAIKQFTQFGAGYKIAMKDLEIRGAGNILGKSQSGHMTSIGYELYVRMLEERVKQLKDGDVISEDLCFDCNVDLKVDGFIPRTYIENEVEKIEIYKKIAVIDSLEEMQDLEDELVDRFGDLPDPTTNLLRMAYLKSRARRIKVMEIKGDTTQVDFIVSNEAPINPDKLLGLIKSYGRKLKFRAGASSSFSLNISSAKTFLNELEAFINALYEISESQK